MKKTTAVRNYYVLPCCLLLLNVCNSLVSYKAGGVIDEPFLRTTVVILFVLFGGTLVAFVLSPAIETFVGYLHRTSRKGAGGLGEVIFLLLLGAAVFFLYYQLTVHGPASLLPAKWRNGHLHG